MIGDETQRSRIGRETTDKERVFVYAFILIYWPISLYLLQGAPFWTEWKFVVTLGALIATVVIASYAVVLNRRCRDAR